MATDPEETVIFSGAEDTVHDAPAFGPGDRVEFSVDYPDLPNIDVVARAGEAATIVGICPTKRVTYEVRLDSEPDVKWPRVVAGQYLVPEGSGLRGKQVTQTVLVRHTGELRRF